MTSPTKHDFHIEGGILAVSFPRIESDTWLTSEQAREWARWLNIHADALDTIALTTANCPQPPVGDT